MKTVLSKPRLPALPAVNLTTHWKLMLVSFMFAAGVLCGAILVKNGGPGFGKYISELFSDYVKSRADASFFRIFWFSVVSALPFFAAAFLGGLAAFGLPVALLTPFVRGLGFGAVAGWLYAAEGLKGVGFSALLMVPHNVLSTVALLLCCREAIGFSLVFASFLTSKGRPCPLHEDFKLYCARFGVLLGILLLAGLTDALMSRIFLGFFKF